LRFRQKANSKRASAMAACEVPLSKEDSNIARIRTKKCTNKYRLASMTQGGILFKLPHIRLAMSYMGELYKKMVPCLCGRGTDGVVPF